MNGVPPTTVEPEHGPSAEPAAAPAIVLRHRALLGRTALVSFLTLLSRIAGFAREALTAALFGHASAVSDAFITAWRIPNLFRALMAEGAIATALQTEQTRADHERGEAGGRAFFQAILRAVLFASCAGCALALLVLVVLPDSMPLTGWSWLGSEPGAVREFTARMLPFVVLVCVSAVLSGALNVRGHYVLPNLAPVLMNGGWVLALLGIGAALGTSAPAGLEGAGEQARQLAMARWIAGYVLLAGVILVVVQWPALRAFGLRGPVPDEERSQARRAAWRALVASLPQAVSVSVYQLSALAGGLLAVGLLSEGGSSLLYYVSRLQQLPLSLVAVAATSAVFPLLSALGETRQHERLGQLLTTTNLAIAYVAIPASIGLFVFAEPVLAVCFEHGAFASAGVERAVGGLRAAALAILPAGAAGLLARSAIAVGDRRAPVLVAGALILGSAALGAGLVVGVGMDLAGLAWGATAAAWLNLAILTPRLRSRLGGTWDLAVVPGRVARMALAAGAAVGLAWVAHRALASERASALALGLCILLSVLLYGLFSQALAIPEWRALRQELRRRAG